MKIWIYSFCWNEKDFLPFYLRHYSLFAEKIILIDDRSDDGTREIASENPLVEVRDCPFTGLNDNSNLDYCQKAYREARNKADWVMWVDIDEIIYGDVIGILSDTEEDIEVLSTLGINMMHDGLPKDDGRQIYEICDKGIHSPIYGKPVVFRPSAEIKWTRGRHHLENCQAKLHHEAKLKLLHYRYMGFDYTRKRNLRNLERTGDTAPDGPGWSCHPNWKGEHSPEWVIEAGKHAAKVT